MTATSEPGHADDWADTGPIPLPPATQTGAGAGNVSQPTGDADKAREGRWAERQFLHGRWNDHVVTAVTVEDGKALADAEVEAATRELRAEVERLRARTHEIADEQQRRLAPYVSRCDQFDVIRKWAREHCGLTPDGLGVERHRWDLTSEAIRTVVIAEREDRLAAEAERDQLRAAMTALADGWERDERGPAIRHGDAYDGEDCARMLRAVLARVGAPEARPRRYDQCDDTCTVDCGHCKGQGRPAESAPESGEER